MGEKRLVKTGVERTRNYVLGSIGAYMREDKNLNWIVGVIGSSGLSKNELQKIFASYRQNYSSNPRFINFDNECKKLGYI